MNKDLKMKFVYSLVCRVYSSHLWHSMLDSDGSCSEKPPEKDRIRQTCGSTVGCYELIGLVTEHTKVSLHSLTPPDSCYMNCCAPQALLLWPHNQRWRVRAGEVCDSGETN